MELNESQIKAVSAVYKFVENKDKHNYLLLGPGGSGKTTVITNVFNDSDLAIAFCAFTNKATQVLRTIAQKFHVNFKADFMTIHKLLMLEVKYFNSETELGFTFDIKKISYLAQYDIIIFDECSIISKELYGYLQQTQEYLKFTHNKDIKFIFLGDYWQLPPVGEDKSIVFATAVKNKWPVSKLSKVMRSGNDKIKGINNMLLEWIDVFRESDDTEQQLSKFHLRYPHNVVADRSIFIRYLDDFYRAYMAAWKAHNDVVILTNSRSNCEKTNHAIQDLIDIAANRDLPDKRTNIKFHVGDRCCIDRPIEVCKIDRLIVESVEYCTLTDHKDLHLYNGEIFDIMYVEEVKVITPLNKYSYNAKYFPAQLLTVQRINDVNGERYDIIHINEALINIARSNIKTNERRMFYLNIMTNFIKVYPKLEYGYCITIYKSQGSEWHTVLINMNSIKYCMINKNSNFITIKNNMALFKTTYTALSRASHDLFAFWC